MDQLVAGQTWTPTFFLSPFQLLSAHAYLNSSCTHPFKFNDIVYGILIYLDAAGGCTRYYCVTATRK